MNRKFQWITYVFVSGWCLVTTTNVFATMTDPTYRWQGLLNLGLAMPMSQSVSAEASGGMPADTYQGSASSTTVIELAIQRNKLWNNHGFHWGAALDIAGSQKQSGTIDLYGLSNFDNYTYQYTIARKTLLGTVQWDMLRSQIKWQPYVMAGLGLSQNTTSGYTEAPVAGVSPARPSPAYSGTSTTGVAFELGLGVGYSFGKLWQAQAQYAYLDAGQAKLGTSSYADYAGATGPSQTLKYGMFSIGVARKF